MCIRNQKIGLALSGGGIRAALFHMGVLKFLAEKGRFEQITSISTVSGASLCIGLLLSKNDGQWPSSRDFLTTVLPAMEAVIHDHDIQRALIGRCMQAPDHNRVALFARELETQWGISGNLRDLPASPRWFINCATFETGQNFRFSQSYMGDSLLGYAIRPEFPVSEAIAASAAYPVLLGDYVLDTRSYHWHSDRAGCIPKEDTMERCHLWDGGVYDNLGLDALVNSDHSLDRGIDMLIVSDASAGLRKRQWTADDTVQNTMRIWDIVSAQLHAFRTGIIRDLVAKGNAVYLTTAASAQAIADKSGRQDRQSATYLSENKAAAVRDYPTTLHTPEKSDFDTIIRHGYEVAKATNAGYGTL